LLHFERALLKAAEIGTAQSALRTDRIGSASVSGAGLEQMGRKSGPVPSSRLQVKAGATQERTPSAGTELTKRVGPLRQKADRVNHGQLRLFRGLEKVLVSKQDGVSEWCRFGRMRNDSEMQGRCLFPFDGVAGTAVH
jgi:hypothetical protein